MTAAETAFMVYEQLADRFAAKNVPRHRDIFLVLAADAALAAGLPADAERLRNRLLRVSPNNLLKPFSSFAEALRSADIQLYIQDLKRQYPVSEAEKLLAGPKTQPVVAAPGPVLPVSPEPDVYRLQGEDHTAPPPTPAAAPRPPVIALSGPRHAAGPYDSPTPSRGASMPEENGGSSNWIAGLLFFLTLILALGLAGFSLLRPLIGLR